MPRVSLASVAAALDVSAMTVSRALRGQPGLSDALRRRVLATAERLGYRPDPEIVRLMHHLRGTSVRNLRASLCAMTDFPADAEPRYCTRLRRHAAERARELGFAFSIVRVAPRPGGWAAALRTVRARGAGGVLLLPLTTLTVLDAEAWADLSVVSATSSVTHPRFHEVVPNHAANARLVIDRLAGAGWRRIGLLGLATQTRRTREALPCALAWHHARLGERCAPLLREDSEEPDVVAWARRERPEAIIVDHPPDLSASRNRLIRAGLRPAWALANSRAFFDLAPGLDERDDLVGSAAVDTLASLVARGERGIPRVPTAVSITGCWEDAPTRR